MKKKEKLIKVNGKGKRIICSGQTHHALGPMHHLFDSNTSSVLIDIL